ncbi:hypothetical protein PoB_001247700 [Plakobranchus ocellatus]|uniref:Uncharacterized protein n=1 Tax=Plakobranchus ocellatus TaxID=259542 RepID=A0AAV3YUZ9_9GAST|nr:hypothetical protein PoB_001247700 [Plakobranchus ocellatus]
MASEPDLRSERYLFLPRVSEFETTIEALTWLARAQSPEITLQLTDHSALDQIIANEIAGNTQNTIFSERHV